MSRVVSKPARRAAPWAALVTMVTVAALPDLSAATVRAIVVDEAGAPFSLVQTEIVDLLAGRVVASAETNRDGVATFEDLLHGQYRVSVSRYDRTVVHPDDNPLVPPADFSIVDPRATIDVRLELHRGIPLHVRFVVDGSVLENVAQAYLEELETGKRLERRVLEGSEMIVKLFPGNWRVRIEAPTGLLLSTIDVDGRAIDGSTVALDLRRETPASFVTWEYAAPARIVGRVLFEREVFRVEVAAELIEPGPWIAKAQEGGMRHERIVAGIDQAGRYVLELPDGQWRLRPFGERLAASEPEEEIVALRPGDELRASFVVRKEEGDPSGLLVEVFDAYGERVEDAVVELWPLDEEKRGEEPVARVRSTRMGMAYMRDVPEGDYLIAAAHPNHPEGTLELIGYQPDAEERSTPRVTLNRGGRIEVTLIDPHGLATGDVWVVANTVDAAPHFVKDPFIASAARVPRTLVDQTNRAILRGLYPGTFELAALTQTAFVRFREGDDGAWVETLELRLHANEVRQLEGHVMPAGLVTGRLYCSDGTAVPSRLDLRVVPNKLQPQAPDDERWKKEPTLSLDRVSLTGRERDRFDAGPLPASSYVVALRPAEFERWTWAFGTENGVDAGSFEALEGQQVDLGAIGVDCGPRIRIVADVASGAPPPDLRDLRSQSEHVELSGHVRTIDDEVVDTRQVAVEASERELWLRDLTEGEAALQVRLGHRYFLPDFWVDVPIEATLERGGLLEVTANIADVGGAVAIRALNVVAARLVRDREAIVSVVLGGERAILPNVPAGAYGVELCGDEACTSILHAWSDVEVRALETTRLTFGFPEHEP